MIMNHVDHDTIRILEILLHFHSFEQNVFSHAAGRLAAKLAYLSIMKNTNILKIFTSQFR